MKSRGQGPGVKGQRKNSIEASGLRDCPLSPVPCPLLDSEVGVPFQVCQPAHPLDKRERGFTLLEVLVATLIMGIAVAGVLGGLSASARNAARLTDYDRATLLARSKMDELLADQKIPRKIPIEGVFDPTQVGGVTAGWRARILPFESAPGAGPGRWVFDRVELEIWWLTGTPQSPTRHEYTLEGFRRGLLRPGDL